MFGGAHDDILFGGSGNDYLAGTGDRGSRDHDQLYGGAGRDRFVLGENGTSYYQGSGYAVIKDWEAGLDKIQLGQGGNYEMRYRKLSGGGALDTGIYRNNNLIGVVEDSTNVSAAREDFVFV